VSTDNIIHSAAFAETAPRPPMSHYVDISQLTKVYLTSKGPAIIVKDFNLRIREGEFVCLIGHSGCGKSTVLSMVAGL